MTQPTDPSSPPSTTTPSSTAANAFKPWAGRFNEPTDAFVEAFTASVDFDRRLYAYDIQGSIPMPPCWHARAS
jgi:hypothetical protein